MDDSLKSAIDTLKSGKPLIFPTDTLWGLGVAIEFCPCPDILFELKGRSHSKPIAWLISNVSELYKYGKDIPPYAQLLAETFWPGALTLIVNASDKVPVKYRSNNGTIGLRMPATCPATELMNGMKGCPLATTSANISGEPGISSRCKETAGPLDKFGVAIYNPYPSRKATFEDTNTTEASTVVDCTNTHPRILREGKLANLVLEV